MNSTGDNNNQHELNPVEQAARDSIKKKAKNVTKQASKKAIKATVNLAKHLVVAVVKVIISFLIGVLGPVGAIIFGIILLVMIVILFGQLAFTSGDADEVLDHDAKMHKYYTKQILNKHEGVDYELYVAGVSLLDTEHIYNAQIDTIGGLLATESHYMDIKLGKEYYNVECVKEGEGKGECTQSPTYSSNSTKRVYDYQIFWNKTVTYSYDISFGDWIKSKVKEESKCIQVKTADGGMEQKDCKIIETYTMTRVESYVQNSTEVEDYGKFEQIFMGDPFNYSQEDLYTIEATYLASDKPIAYSQWREGNGTIGSVSGTYDHNVLPGTSVPSDYFPYYMEAQAKYGVDWYYMAAVHYIETKFSTIKNMVSYAGALGHFQFMNCTWVGWSYPGCMGGLGNANIPNDVLTSPAMIKQYGGYGMDVNGNGKADPFEFEDAVMTAAKYLKALGYNSLNPKKAILGYNHSEEYWVSVNTYAEKFKNEAVYIADMEQGGIAVTDKAFIKPVTTGSMSSNFGIRTIGGKTKSHLGVDFDVPVGTPLYSSGTGKVRKINTGCPNHIGNGYGDQCGGEWGNYIRVEHNVNGTVYEIIYAHLTSVTVKAGDLVQQGQVIGFTGNSGSSTGPHLHFEMHKGIRPSGAAANKTAINPILFFNMKY